MISEWTVPPPKMSALKLASPAGVDYRRTGWAIDAPHLGAVDNDVLHLSSNVCG